jgi:hypothetical protein
MVKDESEFYKKHTSEDGLDTHCKDCKNEYYRNRRESHNKCAREYRYRRGAKSMSENKDCTSYLGCYINERILKHVMPSAILMNNNNPGFDLVCGKGYLVDAKASTVHYSKYQSPRWDFRILKNKIPDYFLLVAYKDRTSLEICHMWLIPGDELNNKVQTTISLSTIHKWDRYKIDHTAALNCVNEMKSN